MDILEQVLAAYIEKQAPEQAPLILAGLQLAIPALIQAHTQATPPKAITINFDPTTGTHSVTTEFHPESLPAAPTS